MELNQKIIDASYKLMNYFTKGYQWYHDTPEQPFKYTPGSIWLINPETEKWVLELKNSGKLWYYYKTLDTFSKYLNMEESDFESFIKVWLEDVLEKGVATTGTLAMARGSALEDVLEKGVATTSARLMGFIQALEDVLEKGVVTTRGGACLPNFGLEDVLEKGNIIKI